MALGARLQDIRFRRIAHRPETGLLTYSPRRPVQTCMPVWARLRVRATAFPDVDAKDIGRGQPRLPIVQGKKTAVYKPMSVSFVRELSNRSRRERCECYAVDRIGWLQLYAAEMLRHQISFAFSSVAAPHKLAQSYLSASWLIRDRLASTPNRCQAISTITVGVPGSGPHQRTRLTVPYPQFKGTRLSQVLL